MDQPIIISHARKRSSSPSIFVYAKMTDTQGEYTFKLEIVRRNDDKVIAEAPLPTVNVEDPMANGEIVLELGGLTFDEAGHYDFRLWANGRFVDNKSIRIDLV